MHLSCVTAERGGDVVSHEQGALIVELAGDEGPGQPQAKGGGVARRIGQTQGGDHPVAASGGGPQVDEQNLVHVVLENLG